MNKLINTATTHFRSDGIYLRVLSIPKDSFVIGHKHLTNHLNILLKGSMRITIDGETREIVAPYIFEALANSTKAVVTITDCEFANIHPCKDNDTLVAIMNRVIDITAITKLSKEMIKTTKQLLLGGN